MLSVMQAIESELTLAFILTSLKSGFKQVMTFLVKVIRSLRSLLLGMLSSVSNQDCFLDEIRSIVKGDFLFLVWRIIYGPFTTDP